MTMVTGFLHGAPGNQTRRLRLSGLGVLLVVVLAVLFELHVAPAISKDKNTLEVTIETPAVGSGVAPGTDVAMNGAVVGTVTRLNLTSEGSAELSLRLHADMIDELGRDFTVDYRPLNYFGATAVNISNAGESGSRPIESGAHIWRDTGNDYTMTSLIHEASKVANGSLDKQTAEAIRRALSYSAAMQPLIHSGIVLADTVAQTQKALPTTTIGHFNQFVEALGMFGATVVGVGKNAYDSKLMQGPDEVQINNKLSLKAIAERFFSMIGDLLRKTQTYLGGTLNMVEDAATILPSIGTGVLTPVTMRRLITSLDGAFDPTPGGGVRLKLKMAIDRLPGLQGPVAAMHVESGRR